ncbi:MAG: hypothetical protein ACD_76C00101G0003 [uncultured bacterium]|nr:MAG: hypothetical protein ACD_76C00101G0003 [uncultured bacterium]HBD05686.1 single-stranded-DNA-specific exonuclease RecJ [Candidatus Uhrbacteria bacterium]
METSNSEWKIAEKVPSEIKSAFPELSEIVLQILWNRGITTQEQIDSFLGPDYSRDIHDPKLFSRMGEAVDRVFLALQKNETITIHGDYDADGVTGSAILFCSLREIMRKMGKDESKLNCFLPHREEDGYGLAIKTIDHLLAHEKPNLIVTVDCGISDKPAIDYAKSEGIDVIVCDHHTLPEVIPDAILIHPLLEDKYPSKNLSGGAVAFKLACALYKEAEIKGLGSFDGQEKWLLDLVAISLVADCIDLRQEARALEKFGLVVLNKTKRFGLRELIKTSRTSFGEIDTHAVGFRISPRINAAGRMDHANIAFKLLVTEDENEAIELASVLDKHNTNRQKLTEEMFEYAKKCVAEDKSVPVIAVKQSWPAGLLGLVAGKMTHEVHMPVFAITDKSGVYTGSGRSVEGFDIMNAIESVKDLFSKFGGHSQACGFTIEGSAKFDEFKIRIKEYFAKNFNSDNLRRVINIDSEIKLQDLSHKLATDLEVLRPFGSANPEPVFASKGLMVLLAQTVGKDNKHLRLMASDPTLRANAKFIGFNMGRMAERIRPGAFIDAAFTVQSRQWNGSSELELKLCDVRQIK